MSSLNITTAHSVVQAAGESEKKGAEVINCDVAPVKTVEHEYHQPTQRHLNSRQVAWIGFGGGIGVGLFVGTGAALAKSGPLGILLAYMITGSIVWTVISCLGEMATLIPSAGSTPHFVTRFFHPALGFTVGWNYWYVCATSVASELSAITLIIRYWTDINPAVWVTVCFLPMIGINLLMVRAYGNVEIIMSSIKVITFCGLIIVSLVIDLGGAPNHDRLGFRFWKDPGVFNHFDGIEGSLGAFLAFFSAFISSAFSYGGTESVIFAAGESTNPSRQIPKAAKRVVYRIMFFYITGALLVGMINPYTEPKLLGGTGNAGSSPFVIAMQRSGITILPSIFNAAILTSAWSAGNTYLYISSRILVSLSIDRAAPKVFQRVSRKGVPYYAVLFSSLLGLLAYLTAGSGGAAQAFEWLLNLNGLTYILLWGTYTATFTRFRRALKAQGIDYRSLVFYAKLQPYMAYYATVVCAIVALFSGFGVFIKGHWSTSNFFANYISLAVYFLPIAIWKVVKRNQVKLVHTFEADLYTGRLAPEDEVAELSPTTWYGKVFAFF